MTDLKLGTIVRFAHEANGGPVHRVVSVMHDDMIEVHDMGGYFAPHLFVVADDIGGIPESPQPSGECRPDSFYHEEFEAYASKSFLNMRFDTWHESGGYDDVYTCNIYYAWLDGLGASAKRDPDLAAARTKNAQLRARVEELEALLTRWCQCPEITDIDPGDLEPETDQVWRETRTALAKETDHGPLTLGDADQPAASTGRGDVSEELKPCPFCGSFDLIKGWEPEGWDKSNLRWIQCNKCAGTANSIAAWNTRPPAPPAAKEME